MTKETQPEDQEIPEGETKEMEEDESVLLGEQLEEALREQDQFRTMAQRAQADLANYKRRAADELEEVRRAGTDSQARIARTCEGFGGASPVCGPPRLLRTRPEWRIAQEFLWYFRQ